MNQPSWSRRSFLRGTAAGIGGVALAGMGGVALGGCTKTGEGNTLQDAKDSGTIKVGIAGEKPYGYMEGNKVTGQSPEVARVIFKRLGIDNMEAETVKFDALPNALKNETFDVIAAGMFINQDRCKQVIFSNPDYCMKTALLVLKGSPAENVTNFKQVAKNPQVKLGTMGKGVVEYNWAIAEGVPEKQITPGFDEQADAVTALADGRIHALALTRLSLATQLEDNPNPKLTLQPGFFPVVNGEQVAGCGAYGFRKGDTELRDAFNKELKKLQEADKIFPIVKKFGFEKSEIELAKEETAKHLCTTG